MEPDGSARNRKADSGICQLRGKSWLLRNARESLPEQLRIRWAAIEPRGHPSTERSAADKQWQVKLQRLDRCSKRTAGSRILRPVQLHVQPYAGQCIEWRDRSVQRQRQPVEPDQPVQPDELELQQLRL